MGMGPNPNKVNYERMEVMCVCALHVYIWVYQYMCVLPKVILPLMISGLFFISVMAAIGRPQFATGPQKCCTDTQIVTEYSLGHRLNVVHTFILSWLYSRTVPKIYGRKT